MIYNYYYYYFGRGPLAAGSKEDGGVGLWQRRQPAGRVGGRLQGRDQYSAPRGGELTALGLGGEPAGFVPTRLGVLHAVGSHLLRRGHHLGRVTQS